jgi:hypothetical protein
LPDSVGPWPEHPSTEPKPFDFDAPETPGAATWHALNQTGIQNLRYSYTVTVAQPGCGPRPSPVSPAVTFTAQGDLDGDGTLSTLQRESALSPDQTQLEPAGPLHIRHRAE